MPRTLDCPHCGSEVPAKNINIGRLVAVCPTCDTVFQFGSGGEAVAPSAPATPTATPYVEKTKLKQKPRKVAPSRAIRTFDDTQTGGFEIHKRARSSGNKGGMAGMVFFTVLWDGFMVMWYGIAFSTGAWEMALFGTLHGAVGVGLTYWVLTYYFNVTRIAVTPAQVTVTTTPIYVHAPRRFDATHIDQFYVRSTGYEVNGKPHFEVMADILGEEPQKVVGGFINYADAVYVEQEIEHYLGIEDMPVPGEANPHKLAY